MTARILEYHPEDMTITAEAALLLSDLQAELKGGGQWLPVDPPFPERTTISELLSKNLSGPRRYAFGTIREHLLGLSARLADGRVIKSGGKVVKNVAGYDLHKLFVGSRDTLGTILQATFKVRPLPEKEVVLRATWDVLDKVLDSDLTPVLLDLIPAHVVIGFAGTNAEVDWQIGLARSLGITEPANLDYEREFWSLEPGPQKVSVLPSRLMEAVKEISAESFVARAGNGVIYYRGGKPPTARAPDELSTRLKSVFDPENKLSA
ncbi:MAG TPA: FAD-binding oxidoreductase [Candidatus Binatia bacterium]|nr:FAD-binding oxidoreductase [Candidatus Binatia bacterium]